MATDNINPNASMQTITAPPSTVNPNFSGVTAPVNTAQPSPTTTQVATPSQTASGINPSDPSIVNALNASGQKSDFASRTALAGQYGIQNYTGSADQNTQLLQKYTAGLQTAQQSGKPAPTTAGAASAAVQSNLPQTAADTQAQMAASDQAKAITQQLQNDPGFQQLQKDQQDYLSSQNQQQTLQQQYTDLTDQAGIPAINTQLINMKSIMDGSEQDIRNEITKAGGFATESQVMALTAARNKTMISNYNNLLQTRDDAVNQINTTMGFAKEDQANAQSVAQEKMNYDQQVISYEQKMTANAQQAYQKIIDTPGYGYQALYASTGGDPHTVSLVEGTLGLPPGSLAQLSQIPDSSKTQVVKLDNGNSILINSQTGQTIKTLGGAAPTAGAGSASTDPYVQAHVSEVLNGNETMAQVPANLRNEVALAMNNAPVDQYSPLAASRLSTEANKIAANYINLPQYQLTANGLPYLQRIDAAIKTPGSISDQDLLDSLTKLNTAGNAISDAQVKLITDGKSFSDMASTLANKFKNGGVLSDNQRQQIQSIAKAIFANYQKGYQPVFDKAVAQMDAAGIPKAFQNIPDLNNLSAQSQGGSIQSTPSSLPQDVQSKISSNLTFSSDGKTAYIPRSVWSTLGDQMDAVLKEAQNEGFTLLVK